MNTSLKQDPNALVLIKLSNKQREKFLCSNTKIGKVYINLIFTYIINTDKKYTKYLNIPVLKNSSMKKVGIYTELVRLRESPIYVSLTVRTI